MRNRYLTLAMETVLKWMIGAGSEGELVVEGREAWYGINRTNIPTVNRLLRLVLIRDVTGNSQDQVRRYIPNEEGRKIVNQPDYVPLILKAVSNRSELL